MQTIEYVALNGIDSLANNHELINLEKEIGLVGGVADKVFFRPRKSSNGKEDIYLLNDRVALVPGHRGISLKLGDTYITGQMKSSVIYALLRHCGAAYLGGDQWEIYTFSFNGYDYEAGFNKSNGASYIKDFNADKWVNVYYAARRSERGSNRHGAVVFEPFHEVYGPSEASLGYLAEERELEYIAQLTEVVESIAGSTTSKEVKAQLQVLKEALAEI